jgi:hypothetical protein
LIAQKGAEQNMSQQDHVVSQDADASAVYEANRKSLGLAFLLWFIAGALGGHRFYSGKTRSAICQLALIIVALALSLNDVGVLSDGSLLIYLIWAAWVLFDVFLIPGWIRKHNSLLAIQLGLPSDAHVS